MKLLYVDASLDRVTGGGIAERGVQLCRALSDAGTECTILTLDIGLDAERRAELAGSRLHPVPCLNRRFLVPRFQPGELRALVAGADVVELCSHWSMLNTMVWRVIRALKKPYLVTPAGALVVVGRSKLLKYAYQALIGRRIIRNAAGPIAVTAGELPEFEACGVSPELVTVIPNGVSPPPPAPDCSLWRNAHDLGARRPILFMGRLSYIKGPDILLDAFGLAAANLPEHDLVFVGPDDGMLAGLRAAAEQKGLVGRVHFLGYLTGTEKECAYRAAELLVIPSRKEAMSIVALEAGIRQVPVLISDECGFDEIGTVGGGVVVPVDPAAFATGLSDVLANEARRIAMGRTLAKHISEHYTWGRSAALHQQVCRRVLAQSGRGL